VLVLREAKEKKSERKQHGDKKAKATKDE